jgi:hypothetical protein
MASIAPEVIKERVKVNKNYDFRLIITNNFLGFKAMYNDDTLPTNLISSCLKLEHYFCNIQK